MKQLMQIEPLEPIVSRDGRPFDPTPGTVAHSMPDLSPSMVAGTIRTVIGKHAAAQGKTAPEEMFTQADYDAIKKAVIRGPLYARGETLFYPFPRDMYVYETAGAGDRPQVNVAFCAPDKQLSGAFLGTGKRGLYEDILWPPFVPPYSKEWSESPAFISEELMAAWLSTHPTSAQCESIAELLNHWQSGHGKEERESHFLQPFARDVRHHNEIDTGRRVPVEQRLFTTEAISVPHHLSVLAEVDWEQRHDERQAPLSTIHSMGGERRLAYFRLHENKRLPVCPSSVAEALRNESYVRLVLATPAYFSKGWKPGWLDENLETSNSFPYPAKLRLRWANIPGWRPYSGWSLKEQSEKAVRRMVPAGSVYFFEVIDGNPAQLAVDAWLRSVSDDNRRKDAHDRDDGFGLALWGVWKP